MKKTTTGRTGARAYHRNPTEAGINCRPFSSGIQQGADGIMRNFSTTGSYIETSCRFNPGTILIVRMTQFPSDTSSLPAEGGLRSIGLAEVKWMRDLSAENASRYGMGVRYIE